MVEFRGDEDHGSYVQFTWSCPACGLHSVDNDLARRNEFSRKAAERMRDVARWIARDRSVGAFRSWRAA